MNGSIQPTVELATTNGNNGFAYPYPVMYGNGGFGGNSGFLGGDGWIVLLLLLAFGGNWGGNGNGGFFGGNSFDNGYAWLSNGQKDIMNQTSDGFNSLHLSNQIEGIRDDVNDIQNAICNSTASINSNISNGFYSSEIAAANRQMANMNQAFATQTAITGAISGLSSDLASCCCENRLATCQTQNIVQNEANATRYANANNTRDIIETANRNNQLILDKLCQLELSGKEDKIRDLERQLTASELKVSQTAQNAFISQGFANEVDALYNRLNNCPVPTTPVYGRTPIFTCNNNGCGCGNNANLF